MRITIKELVVFFLAGFTTHQLFRALVPGDKPVEEMALSVGFFVVIYFVIIPAIQKWRDTCK
jgi:hypothetical protein